MAEPRKRPTIACLAWGSLIWDPRQLPVGGEWFTDGPLVPVEFARQSDNGRITLVIDPHAEPARVLWAYMLSNTLEEARAALRDREGIPGQNWASRVGSWVAGSSAPANIPELTRWAEAHAIDAVIWTALAPKFGAEQRTPSADEVVEYLGGLQGALGESARQYVERAPRQIDTSYRRRIEAVLGWSRR